MESVSYLYMLTSRTFECISAAPKGWVRVGRWDPDDSKVGQATGAKVKAFVQDSPEISIQPVQVWNRGFWADHQGATLDDESQRYHFRAPG